MSTTETKRCHLWSMTIDSEETKIPSFLLSDCTLPNWSIDDASEIKYTQLSCTLMSTNEVNAEKVLLDILKNIKSSKIKLVLKMLTSVGEVVSVWTMDAKFANARFSNLNYQSVEPFFIYLDFVIDTMTID